MVVGPTLGAALGRRIVSGFGARANSPKTLGCAVASGGSSRKRGGEEDVWTSELSPEYFGRADSSAASAPGHVRLPRDMNDRRDVISARAVRPYLVEYRERSE